MISSHFSTLYKLTSISTVGRSVDIQHFVQKHKSALDDVITQINENLCIDIKHIERILDNATKEITKKVPVTLTKIYHEFVGQIGSKVQDLVSLPYDIDYMLKLSIDKIRVKLERTYENDVKLIEKNIKYLIDNIRIAANRIFSIFGGRRRGSVFIRPGKRFTMHEIKEYTSLAGQAQRLVDRRKLEVDVTNLIGGLKFLQRHTRETRNSMNRIIQEIHYHGYYRKGGKTFRYYITKLENIKSYYEGLENRVKAMMESWDVLKKILDQKDIRQFLLTEVESLIGVFQGGEGKESRIRSLVKKIKDSTEEAIKKLRTLSRYENFLDSLIRKVDLFGSEIFSKEKRDQPQDLVDNIVNIKRAYLEVIKEVKKGYISDIKTNLRISDVSNWDGKLSSLSSGMNSLSNSELKTEPYISRLKAIKKIQNHLGEITNKRGELSSSTFEVSKITNVKSGITQLKEIQSKIESFGSIAEDIKKVEQAYHFERITLWDISGEVKGLISVISKIVKMRSDIESYIEFLEKIKECSITIEHYWTMKDNLPSIGKIIHELGSCLFYTHHCNYND